MRVNIGKPGILRLFDVNEQGELLFNGSKVTSQPVVDALNTALSSLGAALELQTKTSKDRDQALQGNIDSLSLASEARDTALQRAIDALTANASARDDALEAAIEKAAHDAYANAVRDALPSQENMEGRFLKSGENGAEWVDIPAGSGGVKDWAENDPTSDSYIRSRTHYDEGIVLYPADGGWIYDSETNPDLSLEHPLYRVGDPVDASDFVKIKASDVLVKLWGIESGEDYMNNAELSLAVITEGATQALVTEISGSQIVLVYNVPETIDTGESVVPAGLYFAYIEENFGDASDPQMLYITARQIAVNRIKQLDPKYIPEIAIPSLSVSDTGDGIIVTVMRNGDEEAHYIQNGSQGQDGQPGRDGYTPIRGTDYWTAADIASIQAYCENAIANGAW